MVISCHALPGLSQCGTSLEPSIDAIPGQKYYFISPFSYMFQACSAFLKTNGYNFDVVSLAWRGRRFAT